MTNNSDYPTMEFPYKYTKTGQKELIEKYTNQSNKVTTETIEKEQKNSNNNQENNNASILNLLQTLFQKQENVETMTAKNNIDINKLLNMLINKDFKQKDLLNLLIPLLTNNQNKSENKTTVNAESNVLPTKQPLFKSGYKKVE